MQFRQSIQKYIWLVLPVAIVLVLSVVVFDVFFSKPQILKGIIVEKIFVPSKTVAGPSILSYGRGRRYDYIITAEQHQQWIAFVKMDDGQVLKVNCHSDHYEKKQVGDTLQFKEYIGELLSIDFFSHNEEDEGKANPI